MVYGVESKPKWAMLQRLSYQLFSQNRPCLVSESWAVWRSTRFKARDNGRGNLFLEDNDTIV